METCKARPLSWALHPQYSGTASQDPVLFSNGRSSPQELLPTSGCQHSAPCQFLLAIGHCSSGELTFPMASQDSAPPTHRRTQAVVWCRRSWSGVNWASLGPLSTLS